MTVRICALLLALGLAAPVVAGQQDAGGDLKELNLEQLMKVQFYTASKRAQNASDTPASVTVVTAEDIRTFGYRTLADVLDGVRGLWVNYDRNYSYLGLRGFSRPGDYNTRILLLVNGHRLNDDIIDQALIGTEFPLDIDLIERIEIVRGPSSSLYGTNAFFGALAAHGNTLRLLVNPNAAQRAHLRISAKLLSMATVVTDEPGAKD